MDARKQWLQNRYQLTNYQIAQLEFLFKTVVSEVSKILLMGILFYRNLPFYFFALFITLILRCSMGGIHFYSYIGCFLMSLLYLWLGIRMLPHIPLPLNIQLPVLFACMFICYRIGPITSKYRQPYSMRYIQRCKRISSSFIFLYLLILYIMPESEYLSVGFWVVVLHSLQLLLAKFIKKGNEQNI